MKKFKINNKAVLLTEREFTSGSYPAPYTLTEARDGITYAPIITVTKEFTVRAKSALFTCCKYLNKLDFYFK